MLLLSVMLQLREGLQIPLCMRMFGGPFVGPGLLDVESFSTSCSFTSYGR